MQMHMSVTWIVLKIIRRNPHRTLEKVFKKKNIVAVNYVQNWAINSHNTKLPHYLKSLKQSDYASSAQTDLRLRQRTYSLKSNK